MAKGSHVDKVFIKHHMISPERWFSSEYNDVVHETLPSVR
ncbi:hypothetical protein CU011_1033 [Enterococcus faecium]|nr:hypothetical protein EfmE1039_1624 [Enterococcus faecium E1039]EJY51920.1 hypothetical protein HMPREF1347_00522 [Enterococcus faecium 504]MBK4751956.1 hypothetical protein [Enterococcus faecium]MBK4757645.1 hypothetical protein [Enterococcus faecium]MBK4762591.1 hypothetical protein [Enterococcus faecium]